MRLSATFKVGEVSVAALSDAATEIPLPGFFDDVPDEEWTSALGIDTPATSVPFNFGSFLLRGSGRTVLLDTGFGEQGPYAAAKGAAGLLDRIRDLGVGLDEIDAVIHTHLHFDHVGWNTVTEGDERVPTFRNAVWRVSDEEIKWWNGGAVQPHPDYEHILRDVFDPIVGHGKVESFSGERLVEPFLTSIPTPGHTPGHTSFLLSSAGEHLLLVGDAAHQINPMTGGGIVSGMKAGWIAGQVAAEAIIKENYSVKMLNNYSDAMWKAFGKNYERFYKIKEAVHNLSDEDLDYIAEQVLSIPHNKRTLSSVFKAAVFKKPALIIDVLKVFAGV